MLSIDIKIRETRYHDFVTCC